MSTATPSVTSPLVRKLRKGLGELGLRVAVVAVGFESLGLGLALAWTLIAKWKHGFSTGLLEGLAAPVRVVGADFLVLGGVGALLFGLRMRWPRFRWISWAAILPLLLLCAINGAFLSVSGEQGSWFDLLDAWRRRVELLEVLEDIVTLRAVAAAVGGLSVVVLGSWAMGRWQPRVLGAAGTLRDRWRAEFWGGLAVLGLLISATPAPSKVQLQVLSQNVAVLVLSTGTGVRMRADFQGFDAGPLVADEGAEALARRTDRPNIVVLVWESTRFDYTGLAGEGAKANTPNLDRLARRGFVASQMRSVLPHTTKSMFSMFCGRYPTMHKGQIEYGDRARVACLPQLLADAGYQTMFAQSAFGTFEARPRLVRNFGFQEFFAFEDLRGEKLGYLASDDASLGTHFESWLNARESDAPFLAVMLTSATHHSYKLPKKLRKRAQTRHTDTSRDESRYRLLVQAEDNMLGKVVEALRASGELDRTLILVVGDHGEGFGDHGVKQHDNNYYEEGLHVPFVLAGPGVEVGERSGPANMVDLAPTLLARLGLRANEEVVAGFDLLSPDYPEAAPKFFGCYEPWNCRGFVRGNLKYVEIPRDGFAFVFDLASDPDEREPLPVPDGLGDATDALDDFIRGHLARGWKYEFARERLFEKWTCDEHAVCRHPGAWKSKYRPNDDDPFKAANAAD